MHRFASPSDVASAVNRSGPYNNKVGLTRWQVARAVAPKRGGGSVSGRKGRWSVFSPRLLGVFARDELVWSAASESTTALHRMLSDAMLSHAVPVVVEATWCQEEEARYFSFGPRGEHDFYDTVDNAAIASALARGDRAVRLPPKPFGTFEIRFGASATSSKWTKPPKSGMLQVNLANHNSREVRKWDPDLAAAPPTTNAVHTTANPVSRLGTPLVGRPLAPHVDRHSDAGRRATTHVTPEMRMREAEEQAALASAKCWLRLLLVGAALQLVGCLSIFSRHYHKLLRCAHLGSAMVLVCAYGFDCVLVAHSETWARSPVDPRGGSQPSWRRRFWQGGAGYACLSLIVWLGQTGHVARHICGDLCGVFFFLASFPASVFAPLLLLAILCGPVNKELAALGRAAQ